MISINEDNTTKQIPLFEIQKTKITNERQFVIKQILEEINKERIGTKYKPMTGRGVAMKVSHIPTKDLYYLLSICKDSKNRCGSFSKCFFGSLKVKDLTT